MSHCYQSCYNKLKTNNWLLITIQAPLRLSFTVTLSRRVRFINEISRHLRDLVVRQASSLLFLAHIPYSRAKVQPLFPEFVGRRWVFFHC